tara:strand:- start:755 stop:1216 length:462 start_codon:yes stop_codon:yes gene_type:complete
MNDTRIIHHRPGAPGLRLLGLGPDLMPCKALIQLRDFLNRNTSWAKRRCLNDLKMALSQSTEIVSLWKGRKIIGFGRCTSDSVYRAVLWDVVVDEEFQHKGFGKRLIKALISSPKLKNVEKVYVMTTQSEQFYSKVDFKECLNQKLFIRYYAE